MTEKKRVLILQPSVENSAGRVGSMLDEYEICYHLMHVGRDKLPDPTEYHAIVVLGGSQHVNDTQRYHYTVHEEAYLHQSIKQSVPYLGMCLGGQLLAHTFQAAVKPLPKVHIGFLQIHFTETGKADPLYRDLPDHQQAFQWHEDCFLLPRGAIALAHLTDGFNQAFRYGHHAYGLQYRIDLTEDMLDSWLYDASLKKEFIATYGSEVYRKVEQEAVELFPLYAKHASSMLRNFFRLSQLI